MKTFLLTGCTAGLGLALVKKLVADYPNGHFIVVCRNVQKGNHVLEEQARILKKNDGNLTVIHGDNSDLASIFSCCSKVKNAVEKIDGIFFNAGTMGDCSLDLSALAWSCLTLWKMPYRLATGEGLLRYENRSTKDGFGLVFQSNVLAHFVLLRELSPLFDSSCVIWTSSVTGQRHSFNPADLEGLNGADPYGSSKYVVNLLSVAFNNGASHSKSYICDPGTFASNISFALVPWFLHFIIKLFYKMLQPLCPKLTGTPENALDSLYHVLQNRNQLETGSIKYESRVSFLGNSYTCALPIDAPSAVAKTVWNQLDEIYITQKKRFAH